MARLGRRYPLIIYTLMIDRWWPALLALGLAMLGLAWAISRWGFEAWRWLTLSSVGIFVCLVSIFLFSIRRIAYIQTFGDHFRMVTPFLRFNVSYKRVVRTTTASMGSLFPPKSISNWRRDIIEPYAKMTAVVIELNGFPILQSVLRFYFSPFFFKDKTPHFVIL